MVPDLASVICLKLIFDIGAHIGKMSQQFRAWGAEKVIAIEPQMECCRSIWALQDKGIIGIPIAISSKRGKAEISICDQDTQFSTLARSKWQDSRMGSNKVWARSESVETATLDSLITSFGVPDFIKIDVEGWESEVLKGLTQPVPMLSFEFHREMPSAFLNCVHRLSHLGFTRFALVQGEFSHLPVWWVDRRADLIRGFYDLPTDGWGSIFAAHDHEPIRTETPALQTVGSGLE